MKYQNNKDLAEAQYYLKMLDDFCKSGQVKIPDPTGTAMPWNLKEDPLKDYLIHLFTLKVTIAETGEEVQKFVRQVVNSKIKSKVFYDSVGKFIVECVHHMRFQRQRAWTESHRADDVLDWAPFKRMDEQVWLPLLDQLEQEHAEDGFDKPFFLKLMTGDGASKPENWERLVRDWKVCIDHQVLNKLKDFISLRQNNFETGLVRMMDQITRNMKTKGVSEQRAVQAWELMTNGWTETEFERRLNQVKIQDKYPEIKEIVAKMGRVADANGKDRLTIASGVEMKMEHSAGSDIEGITVGDDLNSLLPLELEQYSDEDFAVVYNGSVGGTYEVFLKHTEQEVRDHITRYGIGRASEDVKAVAREMTAEEFSELAQRKMPIFQMPNGGLLNLQYNKDKDSLDVGTVTNAGLSVKHTFPFSHNHSMDANISSAYEQLLDMEEYQKEEVQEEHVAKSAFRR